LAERSFAGFASGPEASRRAGGIAEGQKALPTVAEGASLGVGDQDIGVLATEVRRERRIEVGDGRKDVGVAEGRVLGDALGIGILAGPVDRDELSGGHIVSPVMERVAKSDREPP